MISVEHDGYQQQESNKSNGHQHDHSLGVEPLEITIGTAVQLVKLL